MSELSEQVLGISAPHSPESGGHNDAPGVQRQGGFCAGDVTGMLREKIADRLYGGGCNSPTWPDVLELADEIIDMVRSSDEGAKPGCHID